jgi:hypothetical protein
MTRTPPPPPTCPDCDHPEDHPQGVGCLHVTDPQTVTYCTCARVWTSPKTLRQARRERDEALDRVTSPDAYPAFSTAVDKVVDELGRANPTFTSDDVWDRLAEQGVTLDGLDPRAMGGKLLALQRSRQLIWTGEYRQSRRRHASPIRVYRLGVS